VAFGEYPPPVHLLGDLGMEAEVTSESTARVRTRVTPFVTTVDGGVRSGVLATLVDVVGAPSPPGCCSRTGWPPPISPCS
jgi:acyl-coenzyme A thioesterase PaaI-like protein